MTTLCPRGGLLLLLLLILAVRAHADGKPDLLGGLGQGILGLGRGAEAIQVDMTWSPGYGHIHYDGLSLLVFAQGKELLSDIGYTHTRSREWTIQSPAHNLVVVDHANQVANKNTLGNLRYFHVTEGVQMMSVDNPQVYPGVTEVYRRTVALVKLDESNGYVVDIFRVKGGQQHDYFLHGSADDPQTLEAKVTAGTVEVSAPASLVPSGLVFKAATNEGEYHMEPGMAYGYLHDLKQGAVAADTLVDLTYQTEQSPAGLRVFTLAKAGDQLIVGTSPAIRGAGSDDSKLGQYNRQFAMLRRPGGDSLFVSILAPYGERKLVQGVKRVDIPGVGAALEVDCGTRKDLIVIDAKQARGTWLGQAIAANTELAMIATEGGASVCTTAVAGSVNFGKLSLDSTGLRQARLLGVERQDGAGTLLLDEGFIPTPGTVIVVDHGGQRCSPYTVKSATPEAGKVRVALAEDPGFEYEAKTQTSKFVFLPRESYTGAHVVRFYPLAQVIVE